MWTRAVILLGVVCALGVPQRAQACWIDWTGGSCDTVLTDTLSFNDSSSYGTCASGYSGCEITTEYTFPAGQEVFVQLDHDSLWDDLDVFVNDNVCGPSGACAAWGASSTVPEWFSFVADGGTYYITVEDYFGGCGSDFELTVACPTACQAPDITGDITCSSDIPGTTQAGSTAISAYSCPNLQYPDAQQWGPEDIYTFTPQQDGLVTFVLDNMSADQDLYVLEDVCDQTGCIAGSNAESVLTDSVTFFAFTGSTYYIVVEGFAGAGTYNLSFQDNTGGCREDCNDGQDNDNDTDVDCDDTDCLNDPNCSEICTDGVDNDGDTAIDCADSDCWSSPNCGEICDDGADNDGDSATDCADSDCIGHPACCDGDGDGYLSVGASCGGNDCNDSNASINPGVPELTCNGIDDNCTGGIDENNPNVDGDPVDGCTDCDDNDANNYPGNTEVCDLQDNDCDTQVDENVGPTPWYQDLDNDGYGNTNVSQTACGKPAGYVAQSGDCDDNESRAFPGNPEVCDGVDNDCDGTPDDGVSPTNWYADLDNDGFGAGAATVACTQPANHVAQAGDCDDNEAAAFPGNPEICDNIDNNCNGSTDENLTATYYRDVDGDGWGNINDSIVGCGASTGYVAQSGDCDDFDDRRFPTNPEVCDSLDNNCNGSIDEGLLATWYQDIDQDGWGSAGTAVSTCAPPNNYVQQSGDCDDFQAASYPGNNEICDTIDNNCNGQVDEGVLTTYYFDADSDGWGTAGNSQLACSAPVQHVAQSGDCDDTENRAFPGNTEVCDNIDNDCDGTPDDGLDVTWYRDSDNDTYGDLNTTTAACAKPAGYVADAQDCDDTRGNVNPGEQEVCDFLDNDCDGLVDAADPSNSGNGTYYLDNDGDGYGDPNDSTVGCGAPSGYVPDDTDCNDNDASVHPNAVEIPYDNIDQDCVAGDLVDQDGDGYPGGSNGTDCNDYDDTVNPAGVESPDGVDDDCNGLTDDTTIWFDDDGDGFTEAGGDCDDGNASFGPNVPEVCDGLDQNCNGLIDDGTECFDDDGDCACEDFNTGTCVGSINSSCSTLVNTDCNDGDSTVSATATEIPGNGVDDDCDGTVDDGSNDPDGDGYLADGAQPDCDPANGDIHPGATEIADGIDNDCDGDIDEGTLDFDDDGDGYSEAQGDCDDDNDQINPDATEVGPDGVDDDCDGVIDEDGPFVDDDLDGLSEFEGDCDDTDAAIHPGAEELENGIDDDCDGEIDDGVIDVDQDGVTAADGDCDDEDGWVYPGAEELCDGVDNDCDDVTDEDCVKQKDLLDELGKCACSNGGSPLTWWMPLLAVAFVRRRRA